MSRNREMFAIKHAGEYGKGVLVVAELDDAIEEITGLLMSQPYDTDITVTRFLAPPSGVVTEVVNQIPEGEL